MTVVTGEGFTTPEKEEDEVAEEGGRERERERERERGGREREREREKESQTRSLLIVGKGGDNENLG